MNNLWTDSEIKILKENYKNMSNKDLANILPNRTVEAIKTQLTKLGLKRQHGKYTFDDVKNVFLNTDYELISTEKDYINASKSTIKYYCPKHKDKGIQKISLGHLLQGEGCRYCGRNKCDISRQINLSDKKEEYKQLCIKNNFIFKDAIRKNGKIQIEFYCKKHPGLGVQEMTPYNMKRDIKGCKYCMGRQLPEWYIIEEAKRINPNIKLLDPYKNLTTSMNCVCIKHNQPTKKTMQEILKGQGCFECGKEKLSEMNFNTIEDVQDRISKLNPHIKIINYNGMTNLADCYCEKHNEDFTKSPPILINCVSGCSKCYVENLRATQGLGIDEFKKRLSKKHPCVKVIGEYVNNSTPIELYCTEHDYFYSLSPADILKRYNCCDKSRKTYKEEQMCQLLEKWGFNIQRGKIFLDCRDKNPLPFDAYMVDYNICVEYDGEQHSRPIRYGTQKMEDAIDKYNYTVRHDEIKNKYCKDNNISLIRVPFWEYENMDYYLFDELVKLKIIQE